MSLNRRFGGNNEGALTQKKKKKRSKGSMDWAGGRKWLFLYVWDDLFFSQGYIEKAAR